MRKIKSKAWDKKLKKFVTDYWIDGENNIYYPNSDLPFAPEDSTDTRAVSDLAPLMQYTGLKDKKGVEIYEGYIVKFNIDFEYGGTEFIAEVIFNEQGFKYKSSDGIDFIRGFDNVTVIGNIYENKELLDV